jgi:heme exporter protein CcmB
MSQFAAIAALVRKDLLVESRTGQGLLLAAVLGALTVAVLALGLAPAGGDPNPRAAAAVWAAYLFGGAIVFERTMAIERADDALSALLLAPVPRSVLYASKLATNALLLLGLAAVVTPLGMLLMNAPLRSWGSAVAFAWALLAGLTGLAAVGTLLSALLSASRLGGGVLSVLMLPLCAPLVLASSTQVSAALGGRAPGLAGAIVLALDSMFIVIGWLLYETSLDP